MPDIPSHHIVYGMCTDYISGKSVVDTDDERYRRKLARFMVEEKGYSKSDLESLSTIETLFSGQFVVSRIDLVVSLNKKRFMIIRYGPGSLVTRERPAIAAARVLDPTHQIPLAVVTNGEDAEVLDTFTGKAVGMGLEAIPDKDKALKLVKTLDFLPFPEGKKREREMRILNTFDVEVCRLGLPA